MMWAKVVVELLGLVLDLVLKPKPKNVRRY